MTDLQKEAAAAVASILTRIGQIEKACKTQNPNAFDQIQHATGSLRQTARDLQKTLDREVA